MHAIIIVNCLMVDNSFDVKNAREREHVGLVIPYCCIKSVVIQGEYIANPFYISVNDNDIAAKEEFKKFYIPYINFLRAKYNSSMTGQQEEYNLTQCLHSYFNFYDKHSVTNLFNRPCDWLSIHKKYRESVASLTQVNQHNISLFGTQASLREMILREPLALFNSHPYIENQKANTTVRSSKGIRCYEDPWAKSVYD